MKYTIELEGEDVVIVFHNPLHPGVKTTEGYAPRTLIDRVLSGDLTFGDEVFPDYKGFGERLSDMNEAGCPMDRSELIRLSNIYHTPILLLKQ